MRIVNFSLNNIKKINLIIVVITIINIVGVYIVNKNFEDYFEHVLNNNLLITEINETTKLMDGIHITDYRQPVFQNLNDNIRGIDLANIMFIEDNSQSMRRNVQDKLNQGIKAQNQIFSPIYDSQTLNQKQINIPLPSLDVDHVIIGQYPENGEVLISESFATDLIKTHDEFSKYQQLLGSSQNDYIISGIYNSSNLTEADEVIIYDSKEKDDNNQLLLIEDYSNDQLNLLENSHTSYIVATDFKVVNYKAMMYLTILVLSLITMYLTLRKEISNFRYICKQNKVSNLITNLNLVLPLLLMIISFLIFQVLI